MSFPREILVSGIALANNLTAGVQSTVYHASFISEDGEGNKQFSSPVARQCVVDYTRKDISTGAGQLIPIIATLTFVGDVAIDPRDIIVLPNGVQGPIKSTPGAVNDPVTGRGLITEVMIGAS